MLRSQVLVGVNAGIDGLHTIIVREEASGGLRLIGEHRSWDVIAKGNPAGVIERVRQSIMEAIKDAQVSPSELLTIGIALPGQIDYDHGILLYSPNFDVRNVPFVQALSEHFNCHIALINDVASYAIGEQRIGAGKGLKHFIYLYVGYGINAALIIDENLYTGADRLAAEFGHTTIDFDGPHCSCGSHGCLEALASRYAIGKKIQTLYKQGEATILTKLIDLSVEPLDISSSLLADAVEQDDPMAIQAIEAAADVFGAGIANVINFLNPRTIILGGDVLDEIDLYFERSVASARRRCLADSGKNVSIVRAALGTTAGAYGAAVFARQRLEEGSGINM